MTLRRTFQWVIAAGLVTESCGRPSVRSPGPVTSRQITHSFSIRELPDSAIVEVHVPPTVRTVRAIITFIARSVDQYAFDDRDWRAMCARLGCALLRIQLPGQGTPAYESSLIVDAAAGGGNALLRGLDVAAVETAHPELRDAKLILFGHSAAGSFVVTFANSHPGRVLAFIRHHSVPVAAPIDTNNLTEVAALTIVGARDAVVGLADSRSLWQAMRRRNAPWAYVSHAGQTHLSVDGLIEAGPLMRDWIEGILDQPAAARSATSAVSAFRANGWLLDDSSGVIVPEGSMGGVRDQTSWIPNATVGFELRRLAGVCKAVTPAIVKQILGASTQLVSESINNCRYSDNSAASRDLVLAISRAPNAAYALSRVQPSAQRPGIAVPLVGDGAFFYAFELRHQRCGSVSAVRFVFVAAVSLCGPGFGTSADTAALNPIARRLLGTR